MSVIKIETPKGERLIVMPEDEYLTLVAKAEGRQASRTVVPGAFANRIFAGEAPTRVFREWRGLSARDLADKAGLSPGHIADIESGRRAASPSARIKLARALGLEPDDLEPANME